MSWAYYAGKLLEAMGLALVGAGFVHGMMVEGGLGTELRLFGIGGAVFVVGWLVERGTRSSS